MVREKRVPVTLGAVPFLCSPLPGPGQEPPAKKLPSAPETAGVFRGTGCAAVARPEAGRGGGELGAHTPARGITADFPSKPSRAHAKLSRGEALPGLRPRSPAGARPHPFLAASPGTSGLGRAARPRRRRLERGAPRSPRRGLPRGEGRRGAEQPILPPRPGRDPRPAAAPLEGCAGPPQPPGQRGACSTAAAPAPRGGVERQGPAGLGRPGGGAVPPLRGGSGVRRPGEGAGRMTSRRRSAVNLGAAAAAAGGGMWG